MCTASTKLCRTHALVLAAIAAATLAYVGGDPAAARPQAQAQAPPPGRTVVTPLEPAERTARQRRGSNRHRFIGLRWFPTQAYAWTAALRLDAASVTDLTPDGYVAATLWAATDGGAWRYGNSHREPYVQISISQGYRGRPGIFLVASQRRNDGRYVEGARAGLALGTTYKVTLRSHSTSVNEGTGQWDFDVEDPSGDGYSGSFERAGRNPRSGSVFAGIETTSKANAGDVEGSELDRVIVPDSGGVTPGAWGNPDQQANLNPQLVRRGPGHAAWRDRFHSFHAHFGR